MKENLKQTAEWTNRMSDLTEGKERETFNYLGHYSLLAVAVLERGKANA
jgi:hypothetical protein